jgi:hypothetical protein
VNIIYKKLRNKKKKLDKIAQTEQKVKSKEIIPNAEQTEMINSKDAIKEEMKDLESIIAMYKEAFPENPVFAAGGKKKEVKKKQQQ